MFDIIKKHERQEASKEGKEGKGGKHTANGPAVALGRLAQSAGAILAPRAAKARAERVSLEFSSKPCARTGGKM